MRGRSRTRSRAGEADPLQIFEHSLPDRADLRGARHLLVELVDAKDTPKMIMIHWSAQPTAVRPAAYADMAGKSMRLLATANTELTSAQGAATLTKIINVKQPDCRRWSF